MAAEISVFHAVTLTVDGGPAPDFGSLVTSVKGVSTSITEGKNFILKRVLVPAATKVTAWVWADTSGFEYLEVRPYAPVGDEAGGFIQIGMRYNAATNAVADADLTPTGSINHWKDLSKSCVGVFSLDTERAYIHATAANEVAQVSSYPGVWSEASKVLGVMDMLAFFNEDVSEDAWFDLLVVPK